MSYELTGASALSDEPCRYGTSKMLVRGPKRDLSAPYVAFLGGTEVYGRFIERPFSTRVEEALSRSCINLGSINAGLDSFLQDDGLREVAQNAEMNVLQVLGAQNISNQYYRVHPRRNDRFLQANAKLCALYPEVDFTEFHFNKHLLSALNARSAERFVAVKDELQSAWVTRMNQLITLLKGRVMLLWLGYDLAKPDADGGALGPEPTLVERAMVDALRPQVQGVIELSVQTAGRADDIEGMVLGQMDFPTARYMIGPMEHMRIAAAVTPALSQVLDIGK